MENIRAYYIFSFFLHIITVYQTPRRLATQNTRLAINKLKNAHENLFSFLLLDNGIER
jgi:hypothetical protein